MDGFKERLNASIQLKLSFFLSLAILAVAVLAGGFSFFAAFGEAHELQDDTLIQIAALVDSRHIASTPLADDNSANAGGKLRDEESRVTVQRLTGVSGAISPPNAAAPLPIPITLADGLHTLDLDGEPFRVLVKTTASGERIAVAQETSVRNEVARDGALRTLLPLLILVPMLILIVANLVRKMFRPVIALSKEIDQRSDKDLRPVDDENLPVEMRPFAVAINRLLSRVTQSMDAQHRFVADAAHELRSPLTAMSLQAERMADAPMSAEARERLMTLQRGIERGRNLMNQLLALAKVQATTEIPGTAVSVQGVYRRVLQDVMPLAVAKGIDIGVVGEQDTQVLVTDLDMIAVVRNLVDNAIRYTPNGGRVDLAVTQDTQHLTLCITDSGPGIAISERDRVFDPFYRTLGSDELGSGLGLSIVKAICDRIGAEVRLEYSDEATRSGLSVSVLIPIALVELPKAQLNEP
jgi:two-component system OmpR family sensor kinase